MKTDKLFKSARGLCSFLAGIIILAGCTSPEETREKTNIILVMTDDLGYNDVGFNGQEKIKTPHLDQMAEEGMVFSQFYSGSTVCAPSRCALMTGRHMGNASLRGNTTEPLRAQDSTMSRMLKDAGYVTGMFGKWGLGEIGTSGDPAKKGFDQFTGYTDQVEAHFYYNDTIERIIDGNTQRVSIDSSTYNHEIEMSDALDFIRSHKDTTFFAYLPLRLPHAELIAPDEDMEPYLDENGNSIFEEKPFVSDGHFPDQPMPRAAYAAMITKLDNDMGKLLQLLREEGLDKNTIVLFTSDNGADNTADKLDFFDSNAPFRGKKRDLYEGGIHVPMVAWGKNVPRGKESDLIWALWDLPSTFADYAGIDNVPFEHDGISVYNALNGKEQTQKHDHIYFEYGVPWLNKFIQTVRKDKWKLLKIKNNIDAPYYELYNLEKDPGESNNLADKMPEKVESLKTLLKQAHSKPELKEFSYSHLPSAHPVPPALMIDADGKPGALTAKYYQGMDFDKHAFTRRDSMINFSWAHEAPEGLPGDHYSIRWHGKIEIEKDGKYEFYTANDDGVRLWVNEKMVIDDWNSHGVEINSGALELTSGQEVPVRMEYYEDVGGAEVKLRWITP